MGYAEEAEIAQRVLSQLLQENSVALPGLPARDARGALVRLGDAWYTVHRNGNDLRFSEQVSRDHVGRWIVVQVLEHQGGWALARSVATPGEGQDPRAAEQARRLVERTLARLGYSVGTAGREGRRLDPAEIERDVASMTQPEASPGKSSRGRRRTQRSSS